MPTPAAHALTGASIYFVGLRNDRKVFVAAVVAACLPDIDFGISFLTGVNYHHYFTHSLGAAVVFAAAVFLTTQDVRKTLVIGGAYLSHVLLDMLAVDKVEPYGVELFWPLSDRFFISPILVFDDVRRGNLRLLLSAHNWLAAAREIAIVGPIVLGLGWLTRNNRRNPSRSSDRGSPHPPS
ncbi:MAG TPA: metal-dependent hydrolase [Vicinamibacteria bacterium]|nr:metal-dependent hydrolase [Vicinamibacteria bacterium]